MIERYFIKHQTQDRIRASWLAEPIERYVTWLHEQRYAARNVHRRVPVLMRFAAYAQSRGAKVWTDLPSHVQPFVERWVRERGTRCRNERARKSVANCVRGPNEQMLRLVLPDYVGSRRGKRPHPFLEQAPGFFDYLLEERGLSPRTLEYYDYCLRRLQTYLQDIEVSVLKELSPTILSAFVTARGQEWGKNAITILCSALRVFLSYLHREGLILRDLSSSVEAPKRYRLAEIPRSISWNDIGRMLEAVDRRTALGKRDYAILLLLVTYGDYRRQRELLWGPLTESDPLFSFDPGKTRTIHPGTISQTFHHLWPRLNIPLPDGVAPPRLHCLRHSFAVGTLLAWYRAGINPNERLEQLSTFTGHASILDGCLSHDHGRSFSGSQPPLSTVCWPLAQGGGLVSSPTLGQLLFSFFEDHLKCQKGLRPSSIKSYRDTMKLFVQFVAEDAHQKLSRLSVADLTCERVRSFLKSLEEKRHNHIRTRNQRLAALRTFFEYMVERLPKALKESRTDCGHSD